MLTKPFCRSFFANRSMLGLEDEDSLDRVEEVSPPPLSPQAPPQPAPASAPPSPAPKLGKSPLASPPLKKLDQKVSKVSSKLNKSKPNLELEKLETSPIKLTNGNHSESVSKELSLVLSESEEEADDGKQAKPGKLNDSCDDKSASNKKRRKMEKKAKSKELINTTDSESEADKESAPEKVPEPSEEQSPSSPPPSNASSSSNTELDQHIFRPSDLKVKPKGLVDALSNFFTPGLKRTSRTAMNSLIKPDNFKHDDVKKVRLSVDEKEESSKKDDSKVEERKRHASAGQQQVKQLYDGLSHLYNDCDSRLRSAPKDHKEQKEQSEKRGGDKSGDEKAPDAEKDADDEKKARSPLRLTETEGQEKEEEKKSDLKTEEEEKTKGSSKRNLLLGMNILHLHS